MKHGATEGTEKINVKNNLGTIALSMPHCFFNQQPSNSDLLYKELVGCAEHAKRINRE